MNRVDKNDEKIDQHQSMRESRVGKRYFKVDAGYDRAVYENTIGNWFRIIGTFIVFYLVVGLFWWANFSFGIRDMNTATWVFIAFQIIAFILIGLMIFIGHFSGKRLQKAERLMIEVNEEKKKKREEEEKKSKREEAKKELEGLKKIDDSEFSSDRSGENKAAPSDVSLDEASNEESGEDEGADSDEEESETPVSESN
jgi:cytochrome b subunit of formate dehydrogenase